jgi:SRSO17 transposase
MELDSFLQQFDDCIKTKPSRDHLRTYICGQTSKLERKSIEPIALEAGVPPRSLQEFLSLHRWNHEAVRERIQQRVMQKNASPEAIGIIDETGMPKKGDKTPGVQHQYCGASGKQDNCVVTVNLGYASDSFATLLDGELFVPKETWSENRIRCRAAGIPDSVVYRPKWQIALELIDRAMSHGVRFKYLSADAFYGRGQPFRDALAVRGLCYVVEVPCLQRGWTRRPHTTHSPLGHPCLAKGQLNPRRVDHLWLRGGPSWQAYHIKDTEKGPVVWEVRAARFFPCTHSLPCEESWLLVARNVLKDETKYFLSNAAAAVPVETLLHVAFSRSRIEAAFEEAKGDIGYDHFEVRTYTSLQRHIVLSMVSQLFLAEQTQRLRGKKPVVERKTGTGDRRAAA